VVGVRKKAAVRAFEIGNSKGPILLFYTKMVHMVSDVLPQLMLNWPLLTFQAKKIACKFIGG
jgi:hypothetical protein